VTIPALECAGLHYGVREDRFADCLWEGLFPTDIRQPRFAFAPSTKVTGRSLRSQSSRRQQFEADQARV